jgi:hypothetical protein
MHVEASSVVSSPTALGPRLGMRYGPDVWALKKGSLFVERAGKPGRIIKATVKNPGITPGIPSLRAAIEGIQSSYQTLPVMGSDPEFFVAHRGQMVPAFDFLPDKYSATDGLFWDGFQAECTVNVKNCTKHCDDDCKGHFVSCHSLLAQRIGLQLQKLASRELDIVAKPVWHIPEPMLRFAGDAQVSLGCDPSRNAYATYGRVVESPRELEWRFAGGHVHFMLDPEECESPNIRYLVKTLDALLGIPSVCLAQNYDHFIRRRYYGLAGEYRLPPHGLEYRTLSNFWLMHPRAFMLVFDLARHALNIGRARMRNIFAGATQESAIRDTINYCDVRSAKDFKKLNKAFYSQWAQELYGSDKAFWNAIEGGIDKVLSNWGNNVVGQWRLPADWHYVPAWKDLR